ncbi:MAG: hypothetical protein AB7F66_02615 [Bacteriovoracia bacterium]
MHAKTDPARLKALALFLIAIVAPVSFLSGQPTVQHERLRFRNTFKSPEEVVGYYCARDASGFVWSGLLDIERKAFTTWKQVPQFDSFYIAKTYTVMPAKLEAGFAKVRVKYDLVGMGDAHGTRSPAARPSHEVTFNLTRTDGAWKIAKPEPSDIAPVVMESKFNP